MEYVSFPIPWNLGSWILTSYMDDHKDLFMLQVYWATCTFDANFFPKVVNFCTMPGWFFDDLGLFMFCELDILLFLISMF